MNSIKVNKIYTNANTSKIVIMELWINITDISIIARADKLDIETNILSPTAIK